jgi:large subunit ribosomal protein L13
MKKTAPKATPNKAATATAKKPKSRLVLKKAEKAKVAALKIARKSQVRLSREALRSAKRGEKAAAQGKKDMGKVQATIAQAPQSSRISAQKGPIQPEASKTVFVPKYSKDRQWLVVDAAGQTVGRVASEVAMLLRGKHKPTFTPNNDAGDFVVVINADQVRFASDKGFKKRYYKHSGYIGGLKEVSPDQLKAKGQAHKIIFTAVKGMITRSPLGRAQMTKLKIYNNAQHPHAAQKPVVWKLRYSA